MFMPFSVEMSSLILPTKISSLLDESSGVGYMQFLKSSFNVTPGAFFNASLTCSTVILLFVSIFNDSECDVKTGTLTVVADIFIE